MSKRTYAEFADGNDTNIVVLTADGGRIPAHAEVLRLVCSCMKNAPVTDTWDLRQLLVDGKHPTAETVSAMLEVIYQGLGALDFEMDKSPSRFSLLQLCDMLLFADAVGCSKVCLDNIVALLGNCVADVLSILLEAAEEGPSSSTGTRGVQGGRGRGRGTTSGERSASAGPRAAPVERVILPLKGSYILEDLDNTNEVWHLGLCMDSGQVITSYTLTREQRDHVRAEAARQLESLLYTAFKLKLQQLQNPLLQFLRNSTTSDISLLSLDGSLQQTVAAVLTPRVLAEAGSNAKELLSRACMQQPLGRGLGFGTYFKVDDHDDIDEVVCVPSTMLKDLYHLKAGMKVKLKYDLVGGTITITPAVKDCIDGVETFAYTFGTVIGNRQLFSATD